MKFHVLLNEIKAAMLFASKDEARFVLDGVHFEVRPGAAPLMVTTDGRRLTVIDSQAPQEDGIEECSVTLCADELKAVCAYFKPHTKIFPLCIDVHPPKRVVFSVGSRTLDVESDVIIDGNYPAWRRIIPHGDKETVPAFSVNAEFVGDLAKAAKLLDPKQVPAAQFNLYTANSAIDVRLGGIPSFYGIIMPCRMLEEEKWQPDFLGALGMEAPKQDKEAA